MDSNPASLGRGSEHSLLDCAGVYLRLAVDPVCGFILREYHAEIGKDHVPRGRENGTAIAVDIGAHAHDMIFSHHLVLFIDWFDFSLSILYPCIFRSCGQDVCSVVLTWLDHVVSHFQAAFQHSWPIVLFFFFAPDLQHRLELVSTCVVHLAIYLRSISYVLPYVFLDSSHLFWIFYLYKLASVEHLIMIL